MNTALGVLNLDVSRSPVEDRHILIELAHIRGYHLVDVLTIDASTYLPTAHIAERARRADVTALLAPSFEHFGVSARVLPLVAGLVVPGPAGRDQALDRRSGETKTFPTQRHRMRRPVLAAVVLIIFLIAAWALWPTPDPNPPTAVAASTTERGYRPASLTPDGTTSGSTPALELIRRGSAAVPR